MSRPPTASGERRSERGASAVEFALVVPFLIMLLSGIIAFGIVLAQQIALGNAARQTARSAVVPGAVCGATGATGTGLLRAAQQDSTTLYVNPNSVTVKAVRATARPADDAAWTAAASACGTATTSPCLGSAVGDNVYVRVGYTTTLNLPFIQPTFNLSGVGAFRCEYSS